MFCVLDGVRFNPDHLPAHFLKCYDLNRILVLKYKCILNILHNTRGICCYLSTCGVQDACASKVTGGPAGVNAVDLELRELEGGIKGFGADADNYGVHRERDALHNLLSKTIFTGKDRIRL